MGHAALLSPEHVYVLNPPVGKHGPLITPRFVPLFGGCVRAASSLNLDEPLQPLAASGDDSNMTPRNAGIAYRMRMSLLRSIRAGAAVFRTGGGGGEDDNVWQLFGDDVWGDNDIEDDEDYEDGDDRQESAFESDKSSDSGRNSIGSDEDGDVALPEVAAHFPVSGVGEEPELPQPRRRRQRKGKGGKGSGAGKGGKGNDKGSGKSRGKGAHVAKGKSRGKGKMLSWRPVLQQS